MTTGSSEVMSTDQDAVCPPRLNVRANIRYRDGKSLPANCLIGERDADEPSLRIDQRAARLPRARLGTEAQDRAPAANQRSLYAGICDGSLPRRIPDHRHALTGL